MGYQKHLDHSSHLACIEFNNMILWWQWRDYNQLNQSSKFDIYPFLHSVWVTPLRSWTDDVFSSSYSLTRMWTRSSSCPRVCCHSRIPPNRSLLIRTLASSGGGSSPMMTPACRSPVRHVAINFYRKISNVCRTLLGSKIVDHSDVVGACRSPVRHVAINFYRKISNVLLLGSKIVDHSDVVGASPDGAAPTTSSFST